MHTPKTPIVELNVELNEKGFNPKQGLCTKSRSGAFGNRKSNRKSNLTLNLEVNRTFCLTIPDSRFPRFMTFLAKLEKAVAINQ